MTEAELSEALADAWEQGYKQAKGPIWAREPGLLALLNPWRN